MKNKRILPLILVAGMVLSSLTACGNANQKETETQVVFSEVASSETEEKNEVTIPLKETMTFSGLALVVNSKYPLSENETWKYLQERANIKFEITELDPNEANEKGNLIMNGGNYPEFLFKMSGLTLNEYGEKGLLIPLEDLIREYAPNLTKHLDERDGWNVISHSDGHVYSLPSIGSESMQGANAYNFGINERWLENVGMSMPQNMEKLYDVLKAFKEQDANGNGDPNDEIPLSFEQSNRFNALLGYIGDGVHDIVQNIALMEDEIVYYPTTDGYYDFLKEMVKWYEEGLIDQEVFTRTGEQWDALASSGDVLGVYWSNNSSTIPEEYQLEYYDVKPFNVENFPLNTGISSGGLAITDKCENPEVLIAWADYLYTEEGGARAYYGEQDKDWKLTNNGTTYVGNMRVGKEIDIMAQVSLSGKGTVPFYKPGIINDNPDPEFSNTTSIVQARRYQEGGVFTQGTYFPTMIFTTDEGDRLSVLKTDINGYVSTYTAQVVVGELKLEDSWEGFQKTLEAMGVKELEEIYNTAYTRSVLNK